MRHVGDGFLLRDWRGDLAMEPVKKYGRLALAGLVLSHKVIGAFCQEYPSATTWLIYAMALGLVVMRFI
jgi:hypothetical protein